MSDNKLNDDTAHKQRSSSQQNNQEQEAPVSEKVVDTEQADVIETEKKPEEMYTAPEPDSAPMAKPRSRKGLWFIVLLNLLLLMLALAAAGWFYINGVKPELERNQQFGEQQSQMASQLAQQRGRFEQLSEQNAQLGQALQQAEQDAQQARDLADQAEQRARANSRSLLDISGRRPADWLLAEADYLVRMAGRKLWLERDVKTAILMLQSADSRLQDLGDPSLIPIREMIALDVQNLQQLNPQSLSNVALTLGALVPKVEQLTLALPELPEVKDEDKGLSNSPSDWRDNLGKMWDFFREDLIRYEPKTQTIRPMLGEYQQWLARENLKFALLQAKSAVVDEQFALYQQSMQAALALLQEHYDIYQADVEQFVETLQTLQQTEVEQNYPAQLNAARPLQDLLEQRLQGAYRNEVD